MLGLVLKLRFFQTFRVKVFQFDLPQAHCYPGIPSGLMLLFTEHGVRLDLKTSHCPKVITVAKFTQLTQPDHLTANTKQKFEVFLCPNKTPL